MKTNGRVVTQFKLEGKKYLGEQLIHFGEQILCLKERKKYYTIYNHFKIISKFTKKIIIK